jgi:hypothetical protein
VPLVLLLPRICRECRRSGEPLEAGRLPSSVLSALHRVDHQHIMHTSEFALQKARMQHKLKALDELLP